MKRNIKITEKCGVASIGRAVTTLFLKSVVTAMSKLANYILYKKFLGINIFKTVFLVNIGRMCVSTSR